MEPSKILEELFDKKTLTILRHFANNKDRQFYLRELSRSTRVPVATVYRIINRLTTLEIIKQEQIKHLKLYSWGTGKEASFVEGLIEVRKGAVEEFLEIARTIPEIQQVILHGKRQKDKANLLLLGDSIPTSPIIEAVARIKENYDFTIIYLTIGPIQYEQMVQMGLYAGDRQVLLDR